MTDMIPAVAAYRSFGNSEDVQELDGGAFIVEVHDEGVAVTLAALGFIDASTQLVLEPSEARRLASKLVDAGAR